VIRGVGRVFFALRIEREGELPPAPFVVAANHYSHFDPAVVGAVLGTPVRFLAVENLFGAGKVLKWLLASFGAIPTPRERHPIGAVRTALATLEAGDAVGVFPEATRVSHWGTVPPRRGAAWLAKQSGVPLVPVAVLGTGKAFGLENRLRLAPVRVVIGPAIPPHSDDLDTLTRRWSEWIASQVGRFPGSEVSGSPRAFIS